jgi:sugar lactone lactonase YvrE
MKWMEGAQEGVVVAGGHGEGNNLKQLRYAKGVLVDQMGIVYVADWENHRVMCWPRGAIQGNVVIGGNGKGNAQNQFDGAGGLCFDRHGHLYVADFGNHRVQQFLIK